MTTQDAFDDHLHDPQIQSHFAVGPTPSQPHGDATNLPEINDTFVPVKPKSLDEASLEENVVTSLILKFLYVRGTFNGRSIAEQVKLPFAIVEEQLLSLKNQLLIGYRGASVGGDYQYELTPRGVEQARERAARCTYFGAAPVDVDDYIESIRRQSLGNQKTTYERVANAFDDMVLDKSVISQIGQAINSGKSLLLFGSPGNGKTGIATRILRAIDDAIWIPRTLNVGGEVVRLYDPSLHEAMPLPNSTSVLEDYEIDRRWIRIRRPTIVIGGELTLKHLESTLNPVTGIIESPIHMKSNCGCLVLDDFGRQRINTPDLLNRLIVPLERRYDYLSLPTGRQLKLPFDQLVVFSTNLKPAELCDEVFLRRIPYKVHVLDPTEQQFREVFRRKAEQSGMDVESRCIDYLFETHYRQVDRPMRFSHVEDLLNHVRGFCEFHDQPLLLNRETLEVAANNYFASMRP